MVTDKMSQFPRAALPIEPERRDPPGVGHSSNATRLRDENVAAFVVPRVRVQDEEWNVGGFSGPRLADYDRHAVFFNGFHDLQTEYWWKWEKKWTKKWKKVEKKRLKKCQKKSLLLIFTSDLINKEKWN